MHILSVDQFDRAFIDRLFYRAGRYDRLSARERHRESPAANKLLTNLFYEPSTRTSSSFHAAMTKLGGSVIPINDVTYSSVSKGETLEDTIRTMASYSDVIVLRHTEVGAAARAAAVSPVPIINAGDGVGEHPTQALLDLFTILSEQDRIDGITVTLVGDLKHGRTVHSLSKLLRLFDVQVNFVAPSHLGMPDQYTRPEDGFSSTLGDFIDTSDVIYMTRVQKERFVARDPWPGQIETDPVLADTDYGITVDDMKAAKPTMSLMHPFPRNEEIPVEIDADPRAAYFRQMRNGLLVRMALLESVLA
jgi:aspartate carbamoyltransferase catalytic subunit